MPERDEFQAESVTVEELVLTRETGLDFEVLHGPEVMSNRIRSARIQKLGLALAGFTDYIHPDRIQLLGGSEINYLRILDPAACEKSLRVLHHLRICCIVITKGLEVPDGLLAVAREGRFALLRTKALSSAAIKQITGFLEVRLAKRTTIHGVFLEVFGLGVLILGPSGIGKSECALELILRGHRLVADDSVEIARQGVDGLVAAGGPVLRYHMELRGLGIIDVKELFGISATGQSHALDLVVRLERWKPDAEYDRLGFDRPTTEILGVAMPVIVMPVAPGRNVSTLVEVAARAHLLRKRGYRLSGELDEKQIPGREERTSGWPLEGSD